MKKILTLIFSIMSLATFAQTGLVKGKVMHQENNIPFADVSVLLSDLKIITITNEKGEFVLSNVPYGNHTLKFSAYGAEDFQLEITVNSGLNELETVTLKQLIGTQTSLNQDLATMSSEDANSDEMNNASSSGQSVSSALGASRDAYLNAATFGWGQYFYRMRGYENDNSLLFMNGVPMNDLEEGGVFFNSWAGLNDVFRGRSTTFGLAPNEYNFGGLGLNTSLDASASNQRKGTKLTYSATNRSYRNRIMLTHSTGLMKNGWAFSVSLSRRWAQEGQIKGTFYDAFGYYAAAEKRWKNQGLSFMLVGAPLKRGKVGPATDEVFELAGTHYYNPNWGYQDGKVRNSRVFSSNSPMVILTHDAKLNPNTKITTAVSYQAGETSTTGFDWRNAKDPRPVYYRDLPSYQDSLNVKQELIDAYKANPDLLQVQWDELYRTNYNNVKNSTGYSTYILNAVVENSKKLNVAVNLESLLSDHITLHTGLNYQGQKNHNFARVEDLLGGNYVENINYFSQSQLGGQISNAGQLNLLETNTKKVVGDTYGYDYTINFSKATWFAQSVFVYNKVDFFVASELGFTNFYRTGHYLSPIYLTNSYGRSSTNTFFTSKAKGGLTYKINGRNYLYANGAIGTRAPYMDNVIISPRTRNEIVDNPTSEKFKSFEAGYLLRTPSIKARLTFFATDVKNATDIKRYYSDDDLSFASMVMSGINKRYTGIEFGTEIKVSPALSVSLTGALTQAFYTSRPTMKIYIDNQIGVLNNTAKGTEDTVYIKNYYIPSGPQATTQISLNYRSKKYWYASLSGNYMANNWMDFSPTARTKEGVDGLEYNSVAWHNAIDQKKLPNAFTLDLFGGKSFKVNKYIKKANSQMMLLLNVGVSNILNNTNIKLYGFENLRVNNENPQWFPAKSAYALGTTYFLNLSLRF